jgi:Fe-S cluster biogenesis protein NfuA
MEQVVNDVLKEMRPAFQANGADLELREMASDLVMIDIVFGPGACRTCILPPEMLAPTFERLLSTRLGRSVKVIVEEAG